MSTMSALLHAPGFSASSPTPSLSSSALSSMPPTSVRIAVVGDVHDDWSLDEDTKALQFLQVILAMRMSSLSRVLQNLNFLKQLFWAIMIPGALNSSQRRYAQLQLECLGDEHVGYGRLDFPSLKISIVGGRPFSCGGAKIFRKELLSARYGVRDMNESAKRIFNTASGTPEDHLVIFLAHNGPTGLGSNLNDICGKDWDLGGGDHGDPDLAEAIEQLRESTSLNIPLVVFGHMHKELAYGNGVRKMVVVGGEDIIYLNGAIVPRVKKIEEEHCSGTQRAFTVIELVEAKVARIAETWVAVTGEDMTSVKEEHVLFKCGV